MKTKIITIALFASLFVSQAFAQDRTTVSATNADISDNLDLKAVASIFGDSENLDDFERRLNDPKLQISNLDLNNDNQVDYLRVIESVEGRTHLIIVQAVLERDVFQDVATIEVERDDNNQVQVQVVGDVYMYGNNYIYEPVYVHSPIIFASFWFPSYRPYYSSWYWGYYPSYYYAWSPYPIYRYRRNIGLCINYQNNYNYVNVRRSRVAMDLYSNRRSNGYERQNPDRSFAQRNTRVSNRHELVQTRATSNVNRRNEATSPRGNRNESSTPKGNRTESSTPRGNRNEATSPRVNRNESSTPRVNTRSESTPRENQQQRREAPRGNRNETTASRENQQQRNEASRGNRNENAAPRGNQQQRSEAPRGNNQSRGSKRD